jgi:eukaryotic-like serine/threonine-protein kinase
MTVMNAGRGDRGRLDANSWRRIGAVLDRVSDLDVPLQREALVEACHAEGLSVDDVSPYLEAAGRSGQFPGRLDSAILDDVLQGLAAEARSDTLAPGTRLGRYEIVSLIDVGGMGEVYRARDTRLNRIVAVKRLTAHVAASHEGRKRFEREAHATSSLNHPHICTLHDVGEHEGIEFLVMELAEGETLAARLQRGALPMIDALEWATQMTDALAAAHSQGVVHRDLKPANVMLTAHGVKLLDFGLAALRQPPGLVETAHDRSGTAAGTILGTLQYMSPEQLRGKPVDGRTDIFAVGAILYEMIAGRKAFEADSSAGIVAAVLDHTPQPLGLLRPDVPAALDRAVTQCLTKVAEERWHNAADLARHLRSIEATRTVVDPPPASQSAHRRAIAWLALGSVVTCVGAGAITFVLMERRQAGNLVPARFEIPPPVGTSYTASFALSPEGQHLAFTTTDAAGVCSLWIRDFEKPTAQRVESAGAAVYPFWSPDGGSVGFFSDRKLKIVDLATGAVRILTDTGSGGGGAWSADGVIVFADESAGTGRRRPTGLKRISAAGGIATPVAQYGDEQAVPAFPHFLPDGRTYLYMLLEANEPGVYVARLEADERTRILPALITALTPQRLTVNGPLRARYAAGHLFYVDSSRALIAQAFDVRRLHLIGDAVKIAEEVETLAPGLSAFDVSTTGLVVYRQVPPLSRHVSQPTWLDRAALQSSRVAEASRDQQFSIPVPVAPPAPTPIVVLKNWSSLAKP